MIIGSGGSAWETKDVPCKVSKNGSFIQINFKEGGINKHILIPERHLQKINELEKHGDSFETFAEITLPANWYTVHEENNTRTANFKKRLSGDEK